MILDDHSKEWDLFISHASEDKDNFVRLLAEALRDYGLSVWYDEFTLTPGDSLSRSIDRGLANSKYGLAIISESFIEKPWTEYELRGLVAREIEEDKVLIPVWYEITKDKVLHFSPPLVDKVAIITNNSELSDVPPQVLKAVRPDLYEKLVREELIHISRNRFPENRRRDLFLAHELKQLSSVLMDRSNGLQYMLKDAQLGAEIDRRANIMLSDIFSYSENIRGLADLTVNGGFLDPFSTNTPPELLFAKNAAQKEREDIKLESIINHIFRSQYKKLREKNITIESAKDIQAIVINTHKSNIAAILRAILDNAVQYANNNTLIRVAHKISQYSVTIAISNIGQFLSDGEEYRIFQKGFRGYNTMHTSHTAQGMGLFIVRGICEVYGIGVSYSAEELPQEGICRHIFSLSFPKNITKIKNEQR